MRIRRQAIGLLVPMILIATPLTAAELRPYVLPSQQRSDIAIDARVQNQAPRGPAINDSYYEQFARQARTSTSSSERAGLAQSFALKRDQALRDGRTAEAQHYRKLIDILNAIKSG